MITFRIIFCSIALCVFVACQKKHREPSPTVLGTLAVDLDANEGTVRKHEALIGNLIADAYKKDVERRNIVVDFAMVNSGSIRYSSSKRPSGIYPAGVFTAEMADEMLPFGNTNVIIKITGKQLKEILERSVAQYPLAKGPFMQFSKELSVVVDTTQIPQILNIDNSAIVSHGKRIVSIKINNIMCDSLKEYSVIASDFIVEGNDGYVTFKSIPSVLKQYIGEDQANALKEYIITNTPIEPKKEGRIIFQ